MRWKGSSSKANPNWGALVSKTLIVAPRQECFLRQILSDRCRFLSFTIPVMDHKLLLCAILPLLLCLQTWHRVDGVQFEVSSSTTKCVTEEIQRDVLVVGDYKIVFSSSDNLSVTAKVCISLPLPFESFFCRNTIRLSSLERNITDACPEGSLILA
jgi:hypothetical protein